MTSRTLKSSAISFILALCVFSLLAAHATMTRRSDTSVKQRPYVTGRVTDETAIAVLEQRRLEADYQFTVDVLSDWAIHNSPVDRRLSKKTAVKIVKTAMYSAVEHGLDPTLVLALIQVESAFVPDAESHAGALGLTQIIPKWHPEKGVNEDNALDPVFNIRTGVRILSEYLGWHNGDLHKALLQYNGSLRNPTSRYAVLVLSAQARIEKMLHEKRTLLIADRLSV